MCPRPDARLAALSTGLSRPSDGGAVATRGRSRQPAAGMAAADPAQKERPVRLADLTWPEVAEHLRSDRRLLLPVGAVLQHGPHLPLSTDSLIVTRLADALSARHGVLTAPTIGYGVVSDTELEYAGTASLERKTLHRSLNELIASWEDQGVEELVLITSHGYGPHIAALGTAVGDRARIRAVDIHSVNLEEHLETNARAQHAGELDTSLMLHLAPELVRTDRIADAPLSEAERGARVVGEEPVPGPGSAGVVGSPSLASEEKGRRVFEHLVRVIGDRVLAGDRP